MLYLAMNGAKQNMLAQSANSNNLANVSTPGFRADFASFRSMPVFGNGHPTRAYAMVERPGVDLKYGSIETTGNPLDIAVDGDGFIAVQSAEGKEGYTRAGDLRLTANGLLLTSSGEPVLGNGGPISLPPSSKVQISTEGIISVVPFGEDGDIAQEIDRIKLVNPEERSIFKGNDGLFYLKEGDASPANAEVRVVSGAIESSNVNIADSLVNMIELARQFELHVKMMKTADQQAEQISQLMRIS